VAALEGSELARLLTPYLDPQGGKGAQVSTELLGKLGEYLDLLLRWNARTNLTAIREPEQIVQRHFGESLFAGDVLKSRLPTGATLLDFGSGAGFPGIPVQLLLPEIAVCLAESQGKKASFLREAVRTLGLKTEVWAGRVEDMPEMRRFDCVALRAVDHMNLAVSSAWERIASDGWMAILGTDEPVMGFDAPVEVIAIPGGHSRFLQLFRRG
jgi:16S rRNA (guanine527-N7)-methyltransferase